MPQDSARDIQWRIDFYENAPVTHFNGERYFASFDKKSLTNLLLVAMSPHIHHSMVGTEMQREAYPSSLNSFALSSYHFQRKICTHMPRNTDGASVLKIICWSSPDYELSVVQQAIEGIDQVERHGADAKGFVALNNQGLARDQKVCHLQLLSIHQQC